MVKRGSVELIGDKERITTLEAENMDLKQQVAAWLCSYEEVVADNVELDRQLAEAKGEVERLRKLYNGAGEAMNRLKSFGLSDEQWREYLDLDGKSPVQTLEAARADGRREAFYEVIDLLKGAQGYLVGMDFACKVRALAEREKEKDDGEAE